MQGSPDSPSTRLRWPSPAVILGFMAAAAARLLTLPRSLWEGDEVLFVKGIELFDPLHHQPHPPGYPLLIGLGKLFNLVLHNPFASLVTLSVISSLVGYLALVDAFRRMAGSERVAVAGAVLFHFSPAMLVYGPLALSDPPALMFLSLALAAAARLRESASLLPAIGLGVAASAAVGCRPQLTLAVLPLLAVALWSLWSNRTVKATARPATIAAVASITAFTVVSLLWFIPLLVAVGGPAGFLPFLGKQAGLVAKYDASAARTGLRGGAWVMLRFLAHPWGTQLSSLPVLVLALIGTVSLAASRRIEALPLFVLCGVDLVFGLLVMNPSDAVRYALPSLLGVAFLVAVGCEAVARRVRTPALVWGLVVLFCARFIVYTQPVLAARTGTDSPPEQAARWIPRALPANALVLVDPELAPHASYLLPDFFLLPTDPSLRAAAERSPDTPVYLLADGESNWPGAVTFRWRDSDAYGKLTRGHFRIVSVSPIPPERRYAAVRGVGMYEPSVRQPAWRWLGPDAAIRLDLRPDVRDVDGLRGASGGQVAVTLGLPGHAPLGSVPVELAVNGTPAGTVDVPRGGRRTLLLPVPMGAETAEISIRSALSFVPAETGLGRDKRRLAVQLLAVESKAPEDYHESRGNSPVRLSGDPDVQRRGEHRARHLLRDLRPRPLRR
jgi:hypothetical protein